MVYPSLRKLEEDLQINKTTLHNWKKSRPRLYEFIMNSYNYKELLKKNLNSLYEQKELLEDEILFTKKVLELE